MRVSRIFKILFANMSLYPVVLVGCSESGGASNAAKELVEGSVEALGGSEGAASELNDFEESSETGAELVVVHPDLNSEYVVEVGQLIKVPIFQRKIQLQEISFACTAGCPEGVVLLSTGVLRWRPAPEDTGRHVLEITASSRRFSLPATTVIEVRPIEASQLQFLIGPTTTLASAPFPEIQVAATDPGGAIDRNLQDRIRLELLDESGDLVMEMEEGLAGGVASFSSLDPPRGRAFQFRARALTNPNLVSVSDLFDVLAAYDVLSSSLSSSPFNEIRASLIGVNDPLFGFIVQCATNCGLGFSLSTSGDFSWTPSSDDVGTHVIEVAVISEGLLDSMFQISIEVTPNPTAALLVKSDFSGLRTTNPLRPVTVSAVDASGFDTEQAEGLARVYLVDDSGAEIVGGLTGPFLESPLVNGMVTFENLRVSSEAAALGELAIGATIGDGISGVSELFSVKRVIEISDYAGLRSLNDFYISGDYDEAEFEIVSDIDASPSAADAPFVPIKIGDSQDFGAVLEGNGHVIRNLAVDRPTSLYVGLIANLASTGVVRNLRLENLYVRGEEFVGGIAGASSGRIESVAVSGQIHGNLAVGGIAGLVLASGRVTSVVTKGSVVSRSDSSQRLGSLVGELGGILQWGLTSTQVRPSRSANSASGGLIGVGNPGSVINDSVFMGHFDSEALGSPTAIGIAAGKMQGSFSSVYVFDSSENQGVQQRTLPCTGTSGSNPGLTCTRLSSLSFLMEPESPVWSGFRKSNETNSWSMIPDGWHPWPSSLQRAGFVRPSKEFEVGRKVSALDSSNFSLRGFCAPNGAKINVTFTDSIGAERIVTDECEFGRWDVAADLRTLSDGVLNVEMSATGFEGFPMLPSVLELEKDTGCLGATPSVSGFSSGSGTEGDPYVICTLAELFHLDSPAVGGGVRSGEYYQLGNSIDLSPGFLGISEFKGFFDGAGFRFLNFEAGSAANSLFGTLDADCQTGACATNAEWRMQSRVSNFAVPDAALVFDDGPGGIVVSNALRGSISNIYVSGKLYSGTSVDDASTPRALGLIVGQASESTHLERLSAVGSVDAVPLNGDGFDEVGGIVGRTGSSMQELSFSGVVGARRSQRVGGVVGQVSVVSDFDEHLIDSLSTRSYVTGYSHVGGAFGEASAPTVSKVRIQSTVNSRESSVGLCAGSVQHIGSLTFEQSFSNCVAEGHVISLSVHPNYQDEHFVTYVSGAIGETDGGEFNGSYNGVFRNVWLDALLHLNPDSRAAYIAQVGTGARERFENIHYTESRTAEVPSNIECTVGGTPSALDCTAHDSSELLLLNAWTTLLGDSSPLLGLINGSWTLSRNGRLPDLSFDTFYGPFGSEP